MKELLKIFIITFIVWIIISIPSFKQFKNISKNSFKLTLPIENIIKEKEKIKRTKINNNNDNYTEFEENTTNISFDMDLTKPSKYNSSDYNKLLENTNLNGLGESFKKCEKKGINSLFLVALACHESNYGYSSLSTNKNNIFGYMAYDNNPYDSAKYFYNKENCIDYVSTSLVKNYLSENGCFYNGTTLSDINKYYATDPKWSNKIYNIMLNFEKNLEKS